MSRITGFVAVLVLFGTSSLLAPACGSEGGSGFNEDAGSSGASGASGFASGGLSSGGSGGPGSSNGSLGDGSACQATSARAARPPLTMIMGLDQSCSMGDCGGGNERSKRWVPVTSALKGFWANPLTAGISANLRLFPNGNGNNAFCSFATYTDPVVPLTPLPNAAPFEAVLVDNPQRTATPTRHVLRAMATEANAILSATADAKVVVVLVTDGLPQFCGGGDSDIDNVVGEIADQPFPTYVIAIQGVGDDTLEENADAIAAAGNTNEAFMVDTANPDATQTAFTTAIDQIRGALVPSCELAIPAAPAGQQFDKNKVNVTISSGSSSNALGYDPACAGAGWKYDNENTPTQIVLCPQSCEPFKADQNAQLDVAFGCVTRPAGVN